MSWWETLHLVTWWKRLGISAIKTGQDAPSWIWCTERLSFFGGGHIVLQRFVHVRCHFQPLPTKLVFAYFDRGSYAFGETSGLVSTHNFTEGTDASSTGLRLRVLDMITSRHSLIAIVLISIFSDQSLDPTPIIKLSQSKVTIFTSILLPYQSRIPWSMGMVREGGPTVASLWRNPWWLINTTKNLVDFPWLLLLLPEGIHHQSS